MYVCIVLSNKNRNLRKYSAGFFLNHFPKKKIFGGPYICIFDYAKFKIIASLMAACLSKTIFHKKKIQMEN